MLAGVLRRANHFVCLCLTLLLMGCFEVTIPAGDGADAMGTGAADSAAAAATDTIAWGEFGPQLNPTDIVAPPFEDIELPAACSSHCDCPQGWDCTNERCISGTLPIYCCQNDGCPNDVECWTLDNTAGTCSP